MLKVVLQWLVQGIVWEMENAPVLKCAKMHIVYEAKRWAHKIQTLN